MKLILSMFIAVLLTLTPAAIAQQQKAPEKKGPAAAKEVPMSERCIGKTQDGDQCKRKAAEGKKYCWQHDPNRKAKAAKKAA